MTNIYNIKCMNKIIKIEIQNPYQETKANLMHNGSGNHLCNFKNHWSFTISHIYNSYYTCN